MNTESRGQSNQNKQKDKAWRVTVFRRKTSSGLCQEAKNVSLIAENVKLPGNSAFPCGNMRQTLRGRCGCDN